jgi:uncharacterized integral membrane protein
MRYLRYLGWVLKAVAFLLVLGFAIKNTGPVVVRYYLGHAWEAPLALVLLVAFVAGAAVGVAASMGRVLRLRRHAGSANARHHDAEGQAAGPPAL